MSNHLPPVFSSKHTTHASTDHVAHLNYFPETAILVVALLLRKYPRHEGFVLNEYSTLTGAGSMVDGSLLSAAQRERASQRGVGILDCKVHPCSGRKLFFHGKSQNTKWGCEIALWSVFDFANFGTNSKLIYPKISENWKVHYGSGTCAAAPENFFHFSWRRVCEAGRRGSPEKTVSSESFDFSELERSKVNFFRMLRISHERFRGVLGFITNIDRWQRDTPPSPPPRPSTPPPVNPFLVR